MTPSEASTPLGTGTTGPAGPAASGAGASGSESFGVLQSKELKEMPTSVGQRPANRRSTGVLVCKRQVVKISGLPFLQHGTWEVPGRSILPLKGPTSVVREATCFTWLQNESFKEPCSVTLEKGEPCLEKTMFSAAATNKKGKKGATEQLSHKEQVQTGAADEGQGEAAILEKNSAQQGANCDPNVAADFLRHGCEKWG